jgi:mannose-6-phosphate isomerase-like protein (cupin superfamily)
MIRKIAFYFFSTLFVYFIVGGIVFNHIFPPNAPDYATFFAQKPVFSSREEGFTQKIKKVESGWVHLHLTMNPHAAGPPEHVHEGFDEYFTVASGTASILVNGEKKTLRAGETILIPRGTPHKPFNETDATVILNDSTDQHATIPCGFAHGLTRLYPTMDTHGMASPKVLLQLAALGNGFDTWTPDAPRPAQKAIRWLLGPTARLMGY